MSHTPETIVIITYKDTLLYKTSLAQCIQQHNIPMTRIDAMTSAEEELGYLLVTPKQFHVSIKNGKEIKKTLTLYERLGQENLDLDNDMIRKTTHRPQTIKKILIHDGAGGGQAI